MADADQSIVDRVAELAEKHGVPRSRHLTHDERKDPGSGLIRNQPMPRLVLNDMMISWLL